MSQNALLLSLRAWEGRGEVLMAPSWGLWWLWSQRPRAASDQMEHGARKEALLYGRDPGFETAPPTLCSGTHGAALHSPPFAGEFPVWDIS